MVTIGILQFFLPQEKPETEDYVVQCSVRKVGISDLSFAYGFDIQDF